MLERFASEAIGDHPIRLLGRPIDAHEIAQSAVDRIRDWIGSDQIVAIAGYSVAGIMGLFMTAVLLFYFLASGPRVARGLFWIVPPHRRPLVASIWKHLDPVLFRYFLGVLAVVVYATIAAYIGLGVILGIHHALLLALLTGILETVPVIGPTSAAVIAGLISLRTATGIWQHLAYAAYATRCGCRSTSSSAPSCSAARRTCTRRSSSSASSPAAWCSASPASFSPCRSRSWSRARSRRSMATRKRKRAACVVSPLAEIRL